MNTHEKENAMTSEVLAIFENDKAERLARRERERLLDEASAARRREAAAAAVEAAKVPAPPPPTPRVPPEEVYRLAHAARERAERHATDRAAALAGCDAMAEPRRHLDLRDDSANAARALDVAVIAERHALEALATAAENAAAEPGRAIERARAFDAFEATLPEIQRADQGVVDALRALAEAMAEKRRTDNRAIGAAGQLGAVTGRHTGAPVRSVEKFFAEIALGFPGVQWLYLPIPTVNS